MNNGICFAGGGIKGAAHIGALKALEEENIKFDYIGGTSSGSIIATLYSVGYNSDEIYEIFKKYINKINYIDFKNIKKITYNLITKRKIILDGLNSGENIEKIINKECLNKKIKNINEINKKLFIPSVNLCTGKVIIFTSLKNRSTYSDSTNYCNNINIGKAIRASCSYPGVFSPVKFGEEYLIDGGIRENVPWRELKGNGAKKVISIAFENEISKKENINIYNVVEGAIQLLGRELSNYELNGADYIIKIKTKNISLLDKSKIEYLYNKGYEETKNRILEIKNILTL